MAGLAQTNTFMLSTATVMIGKLSELHQLTPSKHSIGLVKNFSMTADPTYLELTQGLSNAVVMSVKNAEGIKCSMEVYEYTPRNLAYASGLDGSSAIFDSNNDFYNVSAEVAADSSTVKVDTDVTTKIAAGDYIFVQDGFDDQVHIAKVKTVTFASAASTITFEDGYKTPTGVKFPVGARVGKVAKLVVGGSLKQEQFAAKIVGILPKDNAPFTILIPKLRITKGLGVAFSSDNYGNLPFEFTPYAGVPEDPMYPQYGAATAVLFPR